MLFAAFATWGILREPVARHTWFAMIFALVSGLLVFSGSLQGDGLIGDLYALGRRPRSGLISSSCVVMPVCLGYRPSVASSTR